MIRIVLDNQGQDRLRRLTVEGHAGFSDQEHGGDIVCSAVSALVGFLGITFTEVLPGAGSVQAADGYFELRLEPQPGQEAVVGLVMDGWCRSVRHLEENYRGWVKVEEQK